MRPRLRWKQPVREAGGKNELKLQALGLVNRHHLHRVAPCRCGFSVVGRARKQRIERRRDVGQQRLGPVEPLVNVLKGLEAVDARAQIGHRLGAVLGPELEGEQLAHRAVFDEDRICKARQRQPFRAVEQPVPGDHRGVQGIELRFGQVLVVVRRVWWFRRGVTAPRQWVALGIFGCEHVHQPSHHARQRPRLLECVSAKAAQCPGPHPAEARGKRPLQCFRVVGPPQRLEIPDQEPDHLVAGGGTGSAHLIRKAERAQRLLERRAHRRGAAQQDREIIVPKLGERRVNALDLPSAEERLVEAIAFVCDDDRRLCQIHNRAKASAGAARLGRTEQPLARVERFLRASPAFIEPNRGGAVDGREIDTKEPRNRAAKSIDRLVRVPDDHKPRTGLGRRQQLQELELSRVDVLELVDEDQPELGAQLLAQLQLRLQQLDGPDDEVAEVEEARGAEPLLIHLVGGGKSAQPVAPTGLCRQHQRSRVDEVLLHQRDETDQVAGECVGSPDPDEGAQHLRIDLGEDLSHHDRLLKAVDQHPARIRRVVAKHAPAEAVERRDPGFCVVVLQPLVDAPADLVGGTGGKGERQDLVARGQARDHRLFVQVDERASLPGPRPGEDSERALDVVYVEWQNVSSGEAGSWIMRGPVT